MNNIFNMKFGGVILMISAPLIYVMASSGGKPVDPVLTAMLMTLLTTGASIVGVGLNNSGQEIVNINNKLNEIQNIANTKGTEKVENDRIIITKNS
jgi:hypothetical protein